MIKNVRHTLTLAAVALVTLAPVASASTAPSAPAGPTETLRLINEIRAEHGLRPLVDDPRLARAARGHSRDMVAKNYFDHVSPTGSDVNARVVRAGWTRNCGSWELSEVIGVGTGADAAPAAIVEAWMESPPHRREILRRSLHSIGIGIVPGTPEAEAGATFTVDLGTCRRPSSTS